ncbi:hypothetical protein COLO4_00377 [Corchorus olitorius]|uniref:Uncharacterized protein n=1 Tax=Corchorus olitorius TaxID=93759 RepID=A0A1R3L3W8_9ROSI|nr:hypothetical protein COLO4_00377 [Corchorus olitorius]
MAGYLNYPKFPLLTCVKNWPTMIVVNLQEATWENK